MNKAVDKLLNGITDTKQFIARSTLDEKFNSIGKIIDMLFEPTYEDVSKIAKSVELIELLEMLETKIKKVFGDIDDKDMEFVNSIELGVLECLLDGCNINYTQKCFISAKIINQNLKALEATEAVVGDMELFDLPVCKQYDRPTLEKFILEYQRNPESEKISAELKEAFDRYIILDYKDRHGFLKTIERMQNFTLNERTKLDYELEKMDLKHFDIPLGIIDYYLGYYELQDEKLSKSTETEPSIPKKIVSTSISKPSKKELKRQLDTLYKPNSEEPFDYINYRELLEILKNLNYADSVVINILSGCNQNCIQNYSYYQLVYERMLFMGKDKEALEELKYYLQSMFICTDEDYECAKTEVIKTLDKHAGYTAQNFDYEMELMRKL